MARYTDLSPFLKDLSNFELDYREPLSEQNIEKIRNKYRGIPESYLDFLKELGAGLYFDGCIDMHCSPSFAEDVCSEVSEMASELKGTDAIVFGLFGDSYYYFVPSKNWAIYGEDHDFSDSYHVSNDSFEVFIRRSIEAHKQ